MRGLILFALVAAIPNTALAWECLTGSCPKWCEPVTYALSQTSPDLGDATTISETQRGMDDWMLLECSGLDTSYAGRTSSMAGASDGQSVIGWIESGWRHDSRAIGVTGPRWGFGGCIVEADMEMNGVHYTWTTAAGRGARVNAYSIILHEGGHYYGLGHSSDRSAAMYGAYGGGIDSINSDDEMGICTLYPFDGEVPDCTASGCPSGQSCVDGRCEESPSMGGGDVCASCSSAADCGGTDAQCLMYPDGSGRCGAACSTDGDCGSDTCADLGGLRQCIRLRAGTPDCSDAPAADGDPCSADRDCRSGYCTEGRCTACAGGPCSDAGTTSDAGPMPMSDAGGTSDAGVGFDSGPGLDAGGTPGQLGDACLADGDCVSGICAVSAAGNFCTQVCDGTCPTGFSCVDAGGSHVCARAVRTGGGCAAGGTNSVAWFVLPLLVLLRRREKF